MDCHRFTDVRQAVLSFPQPALPQVIPLDSASFLNAVLENIAYSARGNCEQLEEQVKVSAIKTIGGMTKSTVWGQLLANVLNRSIRIPGQSEGSLLGAAICASKGAGWYSDLMEASEAMVQWHPPIEPDERATRYKPYYSRWKEIWYRSD
jgi:sugar (pentulose or hexulose) kinase